MKSFVSTNHPGLTGNNFDTFWTNLLQFAYGFPMFPHPKDLVASAAKLQRDSDLRKVALTITKTVYPKTAKLLNSKEFLLACSNQEMVVKREYSDCNTHLLIQGNPNKRSLLLGQWIRTQDMYQAITCLPKPAWFGQRYVPALEEKGELRVFVAGGEMFYAVHTWTDANGNHNQEIVDNVTPLDLLE
jgi:hypothetical protein